MQASPAAPPVITLKQWGHQHQLGWSIVLPLAEQGLKETHQHASHDRCRYRTCKVLFEC